MIVERTEQMQMNDFGMALSMLESMSYSGPSFGGDMLFSRDDSTSIRLTHVEWKKLLEFARIGYEAAGRLL